jgi:hypothetical protein
MCALEVDLVMVLPYRSFSYAYPFTEQSQGDVRQNGQCQIPSKKLPSNKYAGASAEKLEKPGPSIHVALMARVFFFFCGPSLWTKSEVTRVSKVVKLL